MMLFAEAISSASTRSSLEVMLDTIRRKDEQQIDLPPALPTRPTSRGRLPSRRSLLVSTALKSNGQEMNLCLPERRAEVKEKGDRKGDTFECAEKSHAMRMFGLEGNGERQEAEGPVDRKCTSYSLAINPAGQFKSGGAIDYFSNKKLGVWCWLPEEKWECEKIHSTSANNAQVLMPRGKILMLPSEKILPANPVVQDNVNDPALQCFVNEPSILHCLEYRYCQDMIYSKAGPVLVAFDPFKDLSVQENKSVAASLQEVGESGSGKTETAKIAMQLLFAIGSSGIDFEILKDDTILESFGNAKTLQNDNSSRFGELTKIYFSQAGKICGAKIRTFQLEKSRVVQSAVGERSFHVFHQLCAGAPLYLKAVTNAANLLGFEVNALVLALSTQTSYSGNETIVQKLTLSQAVDTRDALAKSIYATLFDWVVVQINKSLHVGNNHGGSSISILDACGFEVSHKNRFDEFCSNYAGEKMQQYFISHLLKYEQEQDHSPLQDSDLSELKSRALKAEAELRNKEEENCCLYQKLQQYETRWSDYDAKMKYLEEMWQKQMTSLQQDHSPLQDSDLSELKSRALKAEAELRNKEEENCCLYQKLQQYETRWSDYDAKMKYLEEMWQKQMTSLQTSLAVAQRSLASNDVANLGRPDVSPNYPYFDSEDAMSVETYTTEGTPVKQSRASGVRPNRTPEGLRNTISHLVKEFEERRQIFEDDAGFLVEVKAGLSVSNLNPHDELSKLKVQFASWKKNYKVRLREVKAALQKIGNSETGKKRRKWWGYWSSK